ncbi:hypothetical protein HK096_009765, partial [Nowakowskiella sp. JEL0078]
GDVDDRVRAIANALGYRIVLWNKDSEDASQSTESSSTAATVLNTIESWFSTTDSFISLEHDISTFTSGIAVNALKAIKAKGSAFQKKILPVATCNNLPFYTFEKGVTSTAASTASSTSTSTSTSSSSPSSLPLSPDGSCGSTVGYRCDVNIS